ncbi:hypothetical protein GGTG_09414 [Gaeumannomyces tritici R3-111a-1]|uniref:Uncharacterized protein n=1 Tax=Gaeumannomyces tritici (strain R3-111a-1) TaxID=644352 RepID=J3P7C0_GAET3|nr:hypothetical protein GGTG_09414 [Gaeumannomyces tritici R3-111a-1]EJT72551.1 hypothetical protein GGTG_09414 [Gaeumannomyces tritici R3-111a-1]
MSFITSAHLITHVVSSRSVVPARRSSHAASDRIGTLGTNPYKSQTMSRRVRIAGRNEIIFEQDEYKCSAAAATANKSDSNLLGSPREQHNIPENLENRLYDMSRMGEGATSHHKNKTIKVPPLEDRTAVALSFYKLGTSFRYRRSGEPHHLTPNAEAHGSSITRFGPEYRSIIMRGQENRDPGGPCVLADIIVIGGG